MTNLKSTVQMNDTPVNVLSFIVDAPMFQYYFLDPILVILAPVMSDFLVYRYLVGLIEYMEGYTSRIKPLQDLHEDSTKVYTHNSHHLGPINI